MKLKSEILKCGKTGECQEHKKTRDLRFVGHYCNLRRWHIPCAIRYRHGQGVELKNQFIEIAKANKLWGFWFWTFTLSDEIRRWIDADPEAARDFLKDLRRVIARVIREGLGVTNKDRKKQPGFSILYHPSSSQDPFKQSSHFHAIVIPLLCDLKGRVTNTFEKRFPHQTLKALYAKYLNELLLDYGLERFGRPLFDVHLEYLQLVFESSINHAFRYTNRSMAEDVLKTIKRVSDDFERFVCVMANKQDDVLIPCLKMKDEILDAIERVLHPLIPIRQSYGYMRTLEKYSSLLGVERDDFDDDDQWQKLYDVEILRMYDHVYEGGRIVTRMAVWIRKKDSQEEYRKLKPDELRGEYASMSNRKLYKVK